MEYDKKCTNVYKTNNFFKTILLQKFVKNIYVFNNLLSEIGRVLVNILSIINKIMSLLSDFYL